MSYPHGYPYLAAEIEPTIKAALKGGPLSFEAIQFRIRVMGQRRGVYMIRKALTKMIDENIIVWQPDGLFALRYVHILPD